MLCSNIEGFSEFSMIGTGGHSTILGSKRYQNPMMKKMLTDMVNWKKPLKIRRSAQPVWRKLRIEIFFWSWYNGKKQKGCDACDRRKNQRNNGEVCLGG